MRDITSQSAHYPFVLPTLPFGYADLEPFMDAKTVETHHSKHHAGYVTNLNAALKDYPALQHMTIDELLRDLNNIPEAVREIVRNQGGGHANHQAFWESLKPGPVPAPAGELAKAIILDFGSVTAFHNAFDEAVVKLFGSGWVFLACDPKSHGRLRIISTQNHDSVISRGLQGLLICDVWEHAYYLKHQNRRTDYLKAYWNLIDWDEVAHRLDDVRAGKTRLGSQQAHA